MTPLSSRNNYLLSVYDVSGKETCLIQSHALPYSLPCRFFLAGHIPGSTLYQSALSLCQEQTQSQARMDISWSPAIYRLDAASPIQQLYVGKLGARPMQEVDFRQAYQHMLSLTLWPILSHRSNLHALVRPLFAA